MVGIASPVAHGSAPIEVDDVAKRTNDPAVSRSADQLRGMRSGRVVLNCQLPDCPRHGSSGLSRLAVVDGSVTGKPPFQVAFDEFEEPIIGNVVRGIQPLFELIWHAR